MMWGEVGVKEGGVWKDIEGSTTQVCSQPGLQEGDRADKQLTLLVIGKIGFGQEWPWRIAETDGKICESAETSELTTVPLDESLYVVTHSMFAQLVAPLWLLKYNPFARYVF
jgi:hypothetical protein